MALIEIDGLPNLKMGGSFRGKLLVITRWYNQMIIDWCDAPIVRAIAGIKPYLIGGLEHFYFPFHIWDVILPIDFHIFQDSWNHQPVIYSPDIY